MNVRSSINIINKKGDFMKFILTGFLFLSLFQTQSHAQSFNDSCINSAEAVLSGNQLERKENAKISCLGNKSNGVFIQQCLLKANVILNNERYAAIACSYNSNSSTIQNCLSLAQGILSPTSDGDLNSAIACSGSTPESNLKIQHCISSQRAVLNDEREAAKLCGYYEILYHTRSR